MTVGAILVRKIVKASVEQGLDPASGNWRHTSRLVEQVGWACVGDVIAGPFEGPELLGLPLFQRFEAYEICSGRDDEYTATGLGDAKPMAVERPHVHRVVELD